MAAWDESPTPAAAVVPEGRNARARTPIRLLKTAHSGVIGDYVTWLTVGTAPIGGIWAVKLR